MPNEKEVSTIYEQVAALLKQEIAELAKKKKMRKT